MLKFAAFSETTIIFAKFKLMIIDYFLKNIFYSAFTIWLKKDILRNDKFWFEEKSCWWSNL